MTKTLPISMHTNHVSSSAILSNNYTSLLSICAHAYKWRKWNNKWNHSSSVTSLKCLTRLQGCEKMMGWYTPLCKVLLFCAKTVVKSHTIWTSPSEELRLHLTDVRNIFGYDCFGQCCWKSNEQILSAWGYTKLMVRVWKFKHKECAKYSKCQF